MNELFRDVVLHSYSDVFLVKFENNDVKFHQVRRRNEDIEADFDYLTFINIFKDRVAEEDKFRFDKALRLDNLIKFLKLHQKSSTVFKLLDSAGNLVPYQFESFLTYEELEYEAVFTFHEISATNTLLDVAVQTLFATYYKILKINILTDSFEEVKVLDEVSSQKLSEWVENFVGSGQIHYQDIDELFAFVSDKNLMNCYNDRNVSKHTFRYRRMKDDGDYGWVAMDIFPIRTEPEPKVMMYIRDIEDDYTLELSEQRKTQYLSTHHGKSGIRNRLSLVNDITSNKLIEYNTAYLLKVKLHYENEFNSLIEETIHMMESVITHANENCATASYIIDNTKLLVLSNMQSLADVIKLRNAIQSISIDKWELGCSYKPGDMINISNLIAEAETSIIEDDNEV